MSTDQHASSGFEDIEVEVEDTERDAPDRTRVQAPPVTKARSLPPPPPSSLRLSAPPAPRSTPGEVPFMLTAGARPVSRGPAPPPPRTQRSSAPPPPSLRGAVSPPAMSVVAGSPPAPLSPPRPPSLRAAPRPDGPRLALPAPSARIGALLDRPVLAAAPAALPVRLEPKVTLEPSTLKLTLEPSTLKPRTLELRTEEDLDEDDDLDAGWTAVTTAAPAAAVAPRVPLPPLVRFDEGPSDVEVTARRPASELQRFDAETAEGDLTRPLSDGLVLSPSKPSRPRPALHAPAMPLAAAPYTSDADLTRPLPPEAALPAALPVALPALPRLPSLRQPPSAARGVSAAPPPSAVVLPPPPVPPASRAAQNSVPLIVAIPPRRGEQVEHAPSIQISAASEVAGNGEHFPPTTQVDWSISSTPPARAPGRQPTLPRIPPAARIPAEFAQFSPRSSVSPVTGSVPPLSGPGQGRRGRLVMALAALTFAVGALAVGLRPRSASVVVTASGPNGGHVAGVTVRVDGVERCKGAPCLVKDLEPGTHFISAAAGSLPGADRAIVLDSGEHAAHHVTLNTVAEVRDAGLTVAAAEGAGLRVFVNGNDLGAPPLAMHRLHPGTHVVRVVGREPYYEAYEERVRLEPGEVRSLGPVRLRLRKGRLELGAGEGTEGAVVTVDGSPVPALPAVIDLAPDSVHEVVARRPGYTDFTHQVVFDGVAERRVDVELEPASGVPVRRLATSRRAGSFARPVEASPSVQVASGPALLDINATTRVAVVLDGRPMGSTPLRGVKVQPGLHTVVFIHSKLGRQVRSVSVGAGRRMAAFAKY